MKELPDGISDARDETRRELNFTTTLGQWNMNHKSAPACERCAVQAFRDGKISEATDSTLKSFQNMKKVRESKVILEKKGKEIVWGKMIDFKCGLGHGVSVQIGPEDL